MSIDTTGIYQALVSLNRTAKTMDSLTQRLSTGKRVASAKDSPSEWVKMSQSRFAFRNLQGINSSLDRVAMNIRVADTTMATIHDYIGQMKTQLEQIVKAYPPFPPGSEERIRMLRSFNAFRKQIDQLTVPPKDEGALKIMADPAVAPEAGDWDVVIGEDGSHQTIHSQQVHTGTTGLNVPELPEDATDEEIYAAMDSLAAAGDTLSRRRAALEADAAAITDRIQRNAEIANFHQSFSEKMEAADMAEVDAEIKSAELKRTLCLESIRSLTGAQASLVELLR